MLLLILILFVGFGLAWAAVPRGLADLRLLPDRDFLDRLRTGAVTGEAEIRAFVERRRAALAWRETAAGWAEIAEARAALALAPDGAGAADIDAALAATRRGLAGLPADARGWLRLAQLESARAGPTPPALAAFRRSLILDPRTRSLIPARVAFGLAAWDRLGGPLRRRVRDQIRLYWRVLPNDLVRQVRLSSRLDQVRQALAGRPKVLWAFDRKMFDYWRHLPVEP